MRIWSVSRSVEALKARSSLKSRAIVMDPPAVIDGSVTLAPARLAYRRHWPWSWPRPVSLPAIGGRAVAAAPAAPTAGLSIGRSRTFFVVADGGGGGRHGRPPPPPAPAPLDTDVARSFFRQIMDHSSLLPPPPPLPHRLIASLRAQWPWSTLIPTMLCRVPASLRGVPRCAISPHSRHLSLFRRVLIHFRFESEYWHLFSNHLFGIQ